MGWNWGGNTSSSESTDSVGGYKHIGGLAGSNGYWDGLTELGGLVSNSFWDVESSGRGYSDGGTGKATAEMQDIATFAGATRYNISRLERDRRRLYLEYGYQRDLSLPELAARMIQLGARRLWQNHQVVASEIAH